MKHCFALRHVPFESLGLLEPLLTTREFLIETVDVPVTDLSRLPLADADLVIVLGGPISAYEEHLYPWLVEELRILEQRLRREVPTIGICLGAQLMARALGARVYPSVCKEIGWAKLELTVQGRSGPLAPIDGQSVLHWHGDTFDLPEGATPHAYTNLTPHQAFAWQKCALALQFHIEVSPHDLEAWYVGHTLELSMWRQMTIPELRSSSQKYGPLLEPHATQALSNMLDVLF